MDSDPNDFGNLDPHPHKSDKSNLDPHQRDADPQHCYLANYLPVHTERAMAHCGSREVLIVGGVGCNLRLQVPY